MEKTVDQIVNNENYVRLNKALEDRSVEIASLLRKEMQKLHIEEIGDYSVRTVRSRSGYSYTSLYIVTDDLEYNSLENTKSCYYCGYFNCWIQAETTQQRIQFLNSALEK